MPTSAPSNKPTPPDLATRCASIDLLLVDVDGVLTDGVIAIDDRGSRRNIFTSGTGVRSTSGRRPGSARRFFRGDGHRWSIGERPNSGSLP